MDGKEEKVNTMQAGSDLSGGLGGVILLFSGKAYNRPCGRGVCLGADMQELESLLPEGGFFISIEARKINA